MLRSVDAAVEPGSFEDRIRDLIGSKSIRMDRNVRHAIERQAALIARGEVGVIGENGARVFSSAATGERCVELDFKVYEQCVGSVEQEQARVFALNGATAEGEDQRATARQSGNGGVFAVAKGAFAVAREDVGDSGACLRFDHIVDVDELPAKARGNAWTNGRLARTHEAGENNAARRGFLLEVLDVHYSISRSQM